MCCYQYYQETSEAPVVSLICSHLSYWNIFASLLFMNRLSFGERVYFCCHQMNCKFIYIKKSVVTLMSWKFLHFHTCVFCHWSHVNIKPTKWKGMQPGRDKQFPSVTQHPDQAQAVRSWPAPWPLSALKGWAGGTFCTMLGCHSFHLRWRRFPLHLLRKHLLDPNHFSKTGKAHASKSLLL